MDGERGTGPSETPPPARRVRCAVECSHTYVLAVSTLVSIEKFPCVYVNRLPWEALPTAMAKSLGGAFGKQESGVWGAWVCVCVWASGEGGDAVSS
jgi:hypothetical protein